MPPAHIGFHPKNTLKIDICLSFFKGKSYITFLNVRSPLKNIFRGFENPLVEMRSFFNPHLFLEGFSFKLCENATETLKYTKRSTTNQIDSQNLRNIGLNISFYGMVLVDWGIVVFGVSYNSFLFFSPCWLVIFSASFDLLGLLPSPSYPCWLVIFSASAEFYS